MEAARPRDNRGASVVMGKRFSRFSKPGDVSRDIHARRSENSSSIFGRPSNSDYSNRRPVRDAHERNRRSFWDNN